MTTKKTAKKNTPAKRKGLSNKVRFEVFKRDSFSCQYCGQSAPDVVLEVDHISPVSKGGKNEILNLITSCWTCNSGKSNRELDDDSIVAKQKAQLDELNEKRSQLEMMLKWRDGMNSIGDMSLDAISNRLNERTGFTLSEHGRAGQKKLLKQFSVVDVLDALDQAIDKYVKRDDEGKIDQESVSNALDKVSGIAYLKSQPESMKALYYARGIMRRRFNYCPDWKAIKLLKLAHSVGADPEDLKDLAKDASSWTDFCSAVFNEWGVSI